ncbi:hypothetical protein JTE90_012450 [Oedothorax gibbosus]|uniref:Uncharacterized protein n=1 Tax=Oedothorax gibbosus TaxID=931172 RepID=A0AAV6U0V8_9ARAC|nr:hypothetical protein JTE90_012450 [Oedothorax gibbosus]
MGFLFFKRYILYTIILTAGVFHLDIIKETVGMLIISIVTLVLSGFCVVSCILLLIGLCVDSRMLLIPWMVLVLEHHFGFISFFVLAHRCTILFGIDFFILGLNAYCLVCVYSQYQIYRDGRQNEQGNGPPPVEYQGHRGGDANPGRISTDTSVPTGYSEITEEYCTQFKIVDDISLINEKQKESKKNHSENDAQRNLQNDFHGSTTHLTSTDGNP